MALAATACAGRSDGAVPALSAPPVALAVVGDSNSTGLSGTIDRGIDARTAWVALLPDPRFRFVGGWAVDGATTTAMADAAVAMPSAEVLVIMGGTNDLGRGVPTETILSELRRIAETVGAPHVVICAIAPFDYLPDEAMTLNASLAEFAGRQGWLFIDPWVTIRNPDGTWESGYRTDGIHTSQEGYAVAAAQIAAQLSSAGL